MLLSVMHSVAPQSTFLKNFTVEQNRFSISDNMQTANIFWKSVSL